MRLLSAVLAGLLAILPLAGSAAAGDRFITVASTTSTANSGLFDAMLPAFEAKTGIDVRVVAVGTGQAVRLARAGDADVLFVHHKPSEEAFVADGLGVDRHDVMYNDFILVGPKGDPAGVKAAPDVTAALKKISEAKAPFASRGDDSGTHKREKSLWTEAGIDIDAASGRWYRATGSGMGATLNIAAAMDAYALADRGTWLSFANRGSLDVMVEGDRRLFNQYGIVLVNPKAHPHVKAADGQTFIDWLTGRQGQERIGAYRINGQQLFTPNAVATN